uniref:Uncharacterized protein n=1 Tax=Siphoviridae sp. ctKy93 TaxID=2827569 RepID=A0A8S5RSB5_9CAUD|nr:MAG TPA: hypothetical protein [Siphoviridae sp. ctKy93]
MAKLITMKQKENEQYVDMYPKTDWSQVNGADAQIATVNNSVDVKVANLQGQINQKQDVSTAVNQGNFKNFVEQYTGKWVLLGQADLELRGDIYPAEVVLAAGTSLKNIVAFKQIVKVNAAGGRRSGGTHAATINFGTLTESVFVDVAGGDSIGGDREITYGAANAVTSYYRVISDNSIGTGSWTSDIQQNPVTSYAYKRYIIYTSVYSSDTYAIEVNPTTCQILTDMNGWSADGVSPVTVVNGNVAVYGLKLEQGEF